MFPKYREDSCPVINMDTNLASQLKHLLWCTFSQIANKTFLTLHHTLYKWAYLMHSKDEECIQMSQSARPLGSRLWCL